MGNAAGVETVGTKQDLPSQETGQAEGNWGAVLFVWGIWALMSLAALTFVGRYGSRVPYYDDWVDLPVWTGEEPVTASWLWTQYAEHRIPLAKVVLVGLAKLSGCNFFAGIIFNALVLSAAAFVLILAARRLRGWTSYPDAFLPLVLLNLGQHETFLISHAVDLVLAMALACLILFLIAWNRTALSRGATLAAGVGLCLLPLSGAIGLSLVPALALWLGYSGVVSWRSQEPHGKSTALLAWGFTAVALLVLGLYFIGFERPAEEMLSPRSGVRATLRGTVEFVSVGFGTVMKPFWPTSGLVALAVVLSGVAVLAVVWRQRPQERFRVLGFFLFLGAMGCLGLAVGWGRSGYGPGAIFASHYVTYAAPLLCGIYLVWAMCSASSFARLVQMCLFTIAVLLFSLNTSEGLDIGRQHRRRMDAFERDLQAGLPPGRLAERHAGTLFPWPPDNPDKEFVASRLHLLRRARVGPFQHMPDDPIPAEVRLPVTPVATYQMTWDNGTGSAWGSDPYLVFALPEPQMVYGVRLKCSVTLGEAKAAGAHFQVFWKRSNREEFAEDRSYREPLAKPNGEEKTITVWIWQTIDQFRIDPADMPCTIKISEITLLVPEAAEEQGSSKP